ncbi:hypothetical protein D5872_18745 [Salmonella enterica subsp. enterica serovar Birkenhead]|nr:hypothetical protein [Salmonella enterica]EBY7194462.1 hypothetical protein [Salmonella enterica subsp. enterica serovar Birkenhead]
MVCTSSPDPVLFWYRFVCCHVSFISNNRNMAVFSVPPRYLIRTPYNGVLASQTRHDYSPQSSMIRGVMSPGLVGRW